MNSVLMIGYMPEPKNFKYKDVLTRGQPHHEPFDSFRLKHPSMPLSRRAKIFAPFDALRGFDFSIREAQAQHDLIYESMRDRILI